MHEIDKEAEEYGMNLLVEEMAEVLQGIGKRGRFGMDTPGVKDPLTGLVDMSITPRTYMAKELGDVMAAIDYCVARGIFNKRDIMQYRLRKLWKLLNPESKDNLGRRLAP
jgi:NTP pyrophosphatase (non-canonical NTP hydrolase)